MKAIVFGMRLSRQDARLLEKRAQHAGMSRGEFLRTLLRFGILPEAPMTTPALRGGAARAKKNAANEA